MCSPPKFPLAAIAIKSLYSSGRRIFMIQKYSLKKVDLELILETMRWKMSTPVAPVQNNLDTRRVEPNEREKSQTEKSRFHKHKTQSFSGPPHIPKGICFEKLGQNVKSLGKLRKVPTIQK